MKKVILAEIFFLRRKREKHWKKKLGCKFIRINTSKEGYNADYEASRVQTFISEYKNEKLKRLEESNQKNKRTRRRNKKTKI